MKALVYGGPGLKEWKEVSNPTILKPTDAIIKVETTTEPVLSVIFRINCAIGPRSDTHFVSGTI